MAKICSICSRSPKVGISRSHSNIATKRRMMLNLQRRLIDGKRVMICTSCLKTVRKNKKKT